MAEKEYIEREAAIGSLLGWAAQLTETYGKNDEYVKCLESAAYNIEQIPAADVRPVVRGRWIRHYEQADTGEDIIAYPCGWVCSECGRWEPEDEPFCNCGAMMEES